MTWDICRCPGCGGMATIGIMSLVAHCACGARRAEANGFIGDRLMVKGEWIIPAEGAD